MLEYKNIKLEKQGKIGILTINRPKALNALNTEVLIEIDQCIDGANNDEDVYAIIITGEGKAFAAGADISEMKDKTPERQESSLN